MTRKEFAMFNCMDQKETDQILDWFLDNFNEKDIERIIDVLVYTVKKSATTIHDLQKACLEIKTISGFDDLMIIVELGKMDNRGIFAAKAGKAMAKFIMENAKKLGKS